MSIVPFGFRNLSVNIPVPGDYDGVGHTEIAVFRHIDGPVDHPGPGGQRVRSSTSARRTCPTSPCRATTTASAAPSWRSSAPRPASGSSRTRTARSTSSASARRTCPHPRAGRLRRRRPHRAGGLPPLDGPVDHPEPDHRHRTRSSTSARRTWSTFRSRATTPARGTTELAVFRPSTAPVDRSNPRWGNLHHDLRRTATCSISPCRTRPMPPWSRIGFVPGASAASIQAASVSVAPARSAPIVIAPAEVPVTKSTISAADLWSQAIEELSHGLG